MAEVTERDIKAALDMEDAREKREEDDGFLGWNLHNRRKCRCWERRPGQQMCMGCERIMANAQFIAAARAESEAALSVAAKAIDGLRDMLKASEAARLKAEERVGWFEKCAKELRHVFHNRLDEQQRKEGEQEPCALCGRMLDAAIHASPEPEASPRVHEFAGPDIHHDFQHNHSLTVSIREKCLVCGFTPQAHLCWSCGLPWSQHGGRDDGK